MANPPIKLKGLLQDKHWQTHRTFCAEYDKAARSVDAALVGAGPSRAQLHRWLSGELLGLPHSDHCRVLETMFPGWTARELFATAESDNVDILLEVIDDRLETPDSSSVGWRNESRSVGVRLLPGASSTGDHAQLIGRRLLHLQQVRRLSDAETMELGGLTGNVVDLHDKRTITIASDGSAEILYECDILNLSDNPITKIAKELWFEHTDGRLDISALPDSERRVVINRRHDTANLSKFALGITPPIQPGEAARISFACRGGRFEGVYYWRHAVHRYTRNYTLHVRHRGTRLAACDAVEEYPEGAEISAYDGLLWDYEGDDVVMTLTRDYLVPGQAVTLRWDATRGTA